MLLRERDASVLEQPNLEWYRKAAKRLLKAARAADAEARGRLAETLGPLPEPLRLADVQRAVAREHGYGSWPAFRRAVLEAQGATVRSVSRIGIGGVEAYEASATDLAAAVGRGDPLALRRVRTHVARLARLSDATLTTRPLARADARLVVAREYGFPTWPALTEGVGAVRERVEHSPGWQGQEGRPMGEAIEAIREGDPERLRALLQAHPELANAQAVRDETLLSSIAQPDVFGTDLRAGLGVDPRCVQVLVEAGADLDVPLQIASCFDRVELVGLLLAAGGRPGARHVWGISAFETAIYHGAHEAADVLAANAPIEPPAFWVYAGLGRVDLLERSLDREGRIREEARRDRPNLSDVGWNPDAEPPDDEATLLAEALTHAARNGRYAAVEWLLDHGADIDAGPFQGLTPLHMAILSADRRMVELLLARGADRTRRDRIYDGLPEGWIAHVRGAGQIRELLR
jgi:hypothetical protein